MKICTRCNVNVALPTSDLVLCEGCEHIRERLVSRAHEFVASRPQVRIDELANALGVSVGDLQGLLGEGIFVSGYEIRCDCGKPGHSSLNGRCRDCHNNLVNRFRNVLAEEDR